MRRPSSSRRWSASRRRSSPSCGAGSAGAFSVDELVELYDAGTGWCLDLAHRIAPGAPWSWDARVADAAFARYVRGASDYAGGRRVEREPR